MSEENWPCTFCEDRDHPSLDYRFCEKCFPIYVGKQIPDLYRGVDLKKDFPRVTIQEGESVYVWGGVGTGKTRMAWGIFKEKRLVGKECIFWKCESLLRHIRASFDDSSETSEKQIVNGLTKVDALILDDLGGIRDSKISDYSLGVFYEIIDHRYSWKKQTMFTSNKSLDQVAKDFDDRIPSRIKEMCRVINLSGKDRRLI
jgi:DNA replication protein DnaC